MQMLWLFRRFTIQRGDQKDMAEPNSVHVVPEVRGDAVRDVEASGSPGDRVTAAQTRVHMRQLEAMTDKKRPAYPERVYVHVVADGSTYFYKQKNLEETLRRNDWTEFGVYELVDVKRLRLRVEVEDGDK